MLAHEAPQTDFYRWFFSSVEDLTPEESASMLATTTAVNFTGFMRTILHPRISQTLTDAQLHALHEAMCRRLEAKARRISRSWEDVAPMGQA